MSYSRRELYALGEPLGDSATEVKVNGDRIYGGGGGKGKKPRRIAIKPANVSTGFGTAVANPQTGQYSYNLDPRLAEMRDMFYGGAESFAPTEQDGAFARQVSDQGMGMFGQGQNFMNQALGMNPNDVAQQYYSDVQNLMSTDRAQEEARLANTLFKTGRTGAATGMEGGYVNPEQFALLRAREMANTQLGIESQQRGRQQQQGDAAFGQQLMGQGLGNFEGGFMAGQTPYNAMSNLFGIGAGIEGLGVNTLGMGMDAASMQMSAQQQQQQVANARAAAGSSGLLPRLGQTAMQAGQMYLNAKTGGMAGGGSGSMFSNLLSGSSPSSNPFSNSGFGNNVPFFNSFNTPMNTNIGMGGFSGPANYGGGTFGPNFGRR